jgi:hypothetical protein
MNEKKIVSICEQHGVPVKNIGRVTSTPLGIINDSLRIDLKSAEAAYHNSIGDLLDSFRK